MNRKKFTMIGICMVLFTASISPVITQAANSENVSSVVNGTTSGAPLWYPTMGHFFYNQGDAQGTFVHFTIDETTGTITAYTVRLTLYPMRWSNYLSSVSPFPEKGSYDDITYENITIFSSIQIPGFVLQAPPNVYADYLIFQGKNTFMRFFDQEGGTLHLASSHSSTKIIFEVPDDFKISDVYDDTYYILPILDDEKQQNNNTGISEEPIDSEPMSSPWTTIWIKSNTTTTSINCYNGTAVINGQTVEIELSAYGYLDIYTWIEYPMPPIVNDFWYTDLNITDEQEIIEDAKSQGLISAEGWITTDPLVASVPQEELSNWDQVKIANTAANNYYTYDDPTFEMTFDIVDKTGVDVVVNSQIPTGRIVIVNVDKEVLQNTSIEELVVSIDDSQISKVAALEDLMEKVENKDANGAYYALSGERLTTVFVYVPHFSTHTISIKSLASGIAAGANVLLPIILSVLFVCLSIGGIIAKKRKQQDDF